MVTGSIDLDPMELVAGDLGQVVCLRRWDAGLRSSHILAFVWRLEGLRGKMCRIAEIDGAVWMANMDISRWMGTCISDPTFKTNGT